MTTFAYFVSKLRFDFTAQYTGLKDKYHVGLLRNIKRMVNVT